MGTESPGMMFARSLFGDPRPVDGPYTPADIPLAAQTVSVRLHDILKIERVR